MTSTREWIKDTIEEYEAREFPGSLVSTIELKEGYISCICTESHIDGSIDVSIVDDFEEELFSITSGEENGDISVVDELLESAIDAPYFN